MNTDMISENIKPKSPTVADFFIFTTGAHMIIINYACTKPVLCMYKTSTQNVNIGISIGATETI